MTSHKTQDTNREHLALILDDAEFHFGGSEKMRKVFLSPHSPDDAAISSVFSAIQL
jgi:hypothetical protein